MYYVEFCNFVFYKCIQIRLVIEFGRLEAFFETLAEIVWKILTLSGTRDGNIDWEFSECKCWFLSFYKEYLNVRADVNS